MKVIVGQGGKYPCEYEFLKIAAQRKLITMPKELSHFKRIEDGRKGEDTFDRILKQFGQKHWLFMRNLWLHDFNNFECDYLLITNHCVYVFEIKNYFGKFEYQNGQCKSRGIDITYNPINQAHNATIHLRNLLPGVPIKGALIFVGEHNQVHIHDEIDYIDIFCRNDLYQYVQDIIIEENQSRVLLDTNHVISELEKYTIDNPYPIKPYYPSQFSENNTGIFCARCGTQLDWSRNCYIVCNCGFHEYREHLTVRTICEYGVLTHSSNFTVSALHYIFQHKLSRVTLAAVLDKYFNLIPTESIFTYENPGKDITPSIQFGKPNKLIMYRD